MRFEFGNNWRSFLGLLNEQRIAEAQRAITASLDRKSLSGLRVLDIGSGSGLSSLAMHRMGADVTSFDYDDVSVACTRELRERFAPGVGTWKVAQGSVLDEAFMTTLGMFDIVYAWGVLHHTGAMWTAIDLAARRVAPGGRLLIALYNEQGWRSRAWLHIKRLYCSGAAGRIAVKTTFYPLLALYALLLDLRLGNLPGTHARTYLKRRGMSLVHDWRDWLGGYPFEVASAEAVNSFLNKSGFELEHQTLTRGWGCNEFVLTKVDTIGGH
jgi:2-polyprenyl-6-hydroxyphenyl methylase/3-demethylubiquinone-9 3-methyltransferase